MLTQGKDDDKEKWQNSRREACYTLSTEGILQQKNSGVFLSFCFFQYYFAAFKAFANLDFLLAAVFL